MTSATAEIPAVIRAIAPNTASVTVRPIPRATGPFVEFFEASRAAGHEGVVCKRRASLYSKMPRENMATRDWLKYRHSWNRTGL